MTYIVKTADDVFECSSIERAYDIYDAEDHAELFQYGYSHGEYIENMIESK